MKFSPGNAQHIGAREEQQDSFGFSDLSDSAFVAHAGVVAVVADGMGGMAHGDAASKTAVQAFLSAYQSKSQRESIPQALDRALREANSAVASLARSADLEDGMGTTLVAAAVHNDSLYWISAGDSRVYLLRRGQLAKLTSDHVYANELREEVAEGKISRSEALSNSQRGDLTSYLGLPDLPEVDRNLRPFQIHPGEAVILCSDGLYKGLSEAEIAASFQGDTQNACEVLVQRVLAKRLPHQDNVTVVALTCDSEEAGKRNSQTRVAVVVSSVFLAVLLSFGGGLWWRALHPAGKPSAVGAQQIPDSGGTKKPPETQPGRSESGAIAPPQTKKNAAKAAFEPPELDFGDQDVKRSSPEKVITVKNNEAHALHIVNVATSGENEGEFHLQKPNCLGMLQVNQKCTIAVTFAPKVEGWREARIVMTDSKGEKYVADLTGHGVAPGQPTALKENTTGNEKTPAQAPSQNNQQSSNPLQTKGSDTSSVQPSPPETGTAQSPPAQSTLTNMPSAPGGTGSSTADKAKKNSAPSAESIPKGTTDKTVSQPVPVASEVHEPSKSQSLGTSGGQEAATSDRSPKKPPEEPTASGKTHGPGTKAVAAPAPVVKLSASLLKIKSGKSKELTIWNKGPAALKIEGITISGQNPADFEKNEPECLRASIQSGSECHVTVSFHPTKQNSNQNGGSGTGDRTAVLVIRDNAGDSPQKVQLASEGKFLFW